MAEPAVLDSTRYQDRDQGDVHRTEIDAGSARRVDRQFGSSRSSIKCIVWLMRVFFFTLVTACLVLSKLTIIEKFARINQLVNLSLASKKIQSAYSDDLKETANLYWQLLFIIMIPSILTWLYSIFKGIFSRSVNHPWPKKSAIAYGIVLACFEAVAEVLLYFVVFTSLPPLVTIFLMSGLFSFQAILNIYSIATLSKDIRSRYENIGMPAHYNKYQMTRAKKTILIIAFVIGIILQITGVASVTGFIMKSDTKYAIGIVLVVCLLILSCTWTSKLQKLTYIPSQSSLRKAVITRASEHIEAKTISARWKAGFIATTTRLILYPILSYIIVRFFYSIRGYDNVIVDPWCTLNNTDLTIQKAFSWSYHDSAVFGVHVVSSFVANIVQGVACYMTLHISGLALPVFFATPISIVIYFLSNSDLNYRHNTNLYFFPFVNSDFNVLDWANTLHSNWYQLMFGVTIAIWLGQLLITQYNLIKSKNVILSSIENMFARPSYYNSVLLEQYLAINRCVSATSIVDYDPTENDTRDLRTVFICSTMYRENATEMRQLLRSIYRVAKYNIKNKNQNIKFESHIFFDGGCHGNDLSQFAIQLMSLVPDALKVNLKDGKKIQTPYGYRFTWEVESTRMAFMIHLKDNQKIKNKKRWSQVMYMNYILKYRAATDTLDLSNTYILTTDADIDFKAEAVVVLLDMLARDNSVGSVCARTHPLGSGMLYWYQVFDYAVGHWLQKSAEHILGSVLCCPGCFSMFRCSALRDCLDDYSTEVDSAIEFLMKDMGEDRWLCTLLVEKGWRLEYCAISKNYTYCPVEFDEFFKQRRRWIPSTVANLWLLVSQGKKMASNNESIGWLFIIYQTFIILSTMIAPATVILIISSGLQSSFSFSAIGVIVTFIILTVGYALICIYTSQQTQLDIAKLMTFFFSIIMAVVVVGIFKEILKDVISNFEDDNEGSGSELTASGKVYIPVGESTIYVALFACVFLLTALLHYKEFFSLFHCLWYLLGLPAGYLLLLVYSTANLNSRSWGTREKSNDNSQGIQLLIWNKLKGVLTKCLDRVGVIDHTNNNPEGKEKLENEPTCKKEVQRHNVGGLEHGSLPSTRDEVRRNYSWLRGWLRKYDCEDFYDCFANEGYTEEWFLAGMSEQDLRDIGICPEGYVRHLMKGIKRLVLTPIQIGIPKDVDGWINELQMGGEDGYVAKFAKAGYFGPDDVEHLNRITKEELQNDIGVYKKAHVKRFLQGLKNLKYRSQDEERMIEAQNTLQLTNDQTPRNLDDDEIAFWYQQLDLVLYPIPESLTRINDLKDELRYLRNSVLIAILLINLLWIILLYLLTIDELKSLGLDVKFLSLAFLAVYGLILFVQFTAMLFHRTVTLAHYISRLNQSLPVECTTNELTETDSNV